MQLVLFGFSYKTAPIELRELVGQQDTTALLKQLYLKLPLLETVVLSTCNRFEIYAIAKDVDQARKLIFETLSTELNIDAFTLEEASYTRFNKFASEHLYQVAAGLDSMILGENEILKQIKDAFALAQSENTLGPILSKQFQSVIEAGKRVRTETDINKGAVSIGSIAADMVYDHLGSQMGKILVVGSGQIGHLTLKHLSDHAHFQFFIANRTASKAEEMAADFERCIPVSMEHLQQTVQDMDVIITCTSSPNYVIDANTLLQNAKNSVLLLDLSVPRNIDPELNDCPHFQLHTMDSMYDILERSNRQRKAAIGHVESILADEKAKFLEWFNTLDVVPTIQSLYQSFNEIRDREIQRALKKYPGEVDAEIEALLEQVTRAITQKILHYPVVHLKMEHNPHKKQAYLNMLSEVFKLDSEDYIDKYIHRTVANKANTESVFHE